MAKTPGDVGKDFDEYARRWESGGYKMEKAWDGSGLARSDDTLRYPGDEWGDIGDLVHLYQSLFARLLPGNNPLNVLEIGAGGGRSTQAVIDVLGDRVDEYHVVDVSEAFVEVLRERIDRPIEVHVVADIDLSRLPEQNFQLCLAQSSWSHISLYDQYRYLRDLRGALAYNAPLIVNGQFLLGLGNDWSWDRFRRRVYQAEHGVEGVFHEFTGVGAVVEQLTRLQYQIEVVHGSGFVARRIEANTQTSLPTLDGPLMYPYLPTLLGYAEGQDPKQVSLG